MRLLGTTWLVAGIISLLLVNVAFTQLRINVVYPREGQTVTAADSTFIFGSVQPPQARFWINDRKVKLYPNGAFLAMIPVRPGNFTFVCQAILGTDTTTVKRNVYLPYYLTTSPKDSLVVDTSYVYPRRDCELKPGDILRVSMKGSPGCRATFSIEGLVKQVPMAEAPPEKRFYWGEAVFGSGTLPKTPNVKGIYTGVYVINPWDWAEQREINFQLVNAAGDTVKTKAPGRLSINNSNIPVIARLTQEVTVATTGPTLAYQLFLPQGVKLWISGKYGHYRRVRLSQTDEVWVKEESLEFLPLGTPPPEGMVTVVRTQGFPDKTKVKVFLQEKLPYKIEQITEPASLLVTIYGVTADTDWIRYDFDDPLIREIRWYQQATRVYQLKIELNQSQQWGYNPYYEGETFILDIHKVPKIAGWPSSPLKDIVICLDPGHNPDTGAVGPTGLIEKDVNLKVCQILKKKLERKGAFVVLTRSQKHGIALTARPQLAAFVGADILLSIHFNALPDGLDPFTNRGTSTYYYHPQSYKLAHRIQKKLLEKLKLPNYGLFYANLALCRPTQMLAVLTEPAFIMHPEEEMLIGSPEFQGKIADAVVEALEDFLKEQR